MSVPTWNLGKMRICIICADLNYLIKCLTNNGIRLEQIETIDEISANITILRPDFRKFKQIIAECGGALQIKGRKGLYWHLRSMIKRPILVIGLIIFVFLSIYLPSHILFVEVVGNSSIPEKLILEKADYCGIHWGASRVNVRSEKVKNALLNELPDLQWAGVNTKGCVAVISVKEKARAEEIEPFSSGVCSIIAAQDGIILDFVVSGGNLLCSIGQAVKAGQTLVSGYTDCGICIRAEEADAEIYALTTRKVQVCTPVAMRKRGEVVRVEQRQYLQVGKKVINFYNNSRIYDPTCVKIENKESISLPGDFSIPVYRITQTYYYYQISDDIDEDNAECTWMSDYAKSYVLSQMIAGEILESVDSGRCLENVYIWNGEYACKEMIGVKKQEEIVQ